MNKMNEISVIEKKHIFNFVLVVSLFALWVLANVIIEPMVQVFKKIFELTNSQAAWVQIAFYVGHFCMALSTVLYIRRYSYKTGVLVGLILYTLGVLLFYPATFYLMLSFVQELNLSYL